MLTRRYYASVSHLKIFGNLTGLGNRITYIQNLTTRIRPYQSADGNLRKIWDQPDMFQRVAA